jgi:hypothetical protein
VVCRSENGVDHRNKIAFLRVVMKHTGTQREAVSAVMAARMVSSMA